MSGLPNDIARCSGMTAVPPPLKKAGVFFVAALFSSIAFAQTRSDPSPSCFRAADGAVVCGRFDAHAVPVGGVAPLIALGLGVVGLTLRRRK